MGVMLVFCAKLHGRPSARLLLGFFSVCLLCGLLVIDPWLLLVQHQRVTNIFAYLFIDIYLNLYGDLNELMFLIYIFDGIRTRVMVVQLS